MPFQDFYMVYNTNVRSGPICVFIQVVLWVYIFQFISMDKQRKGDKVFYVAMILFICAILLLIFIITIGE